MKKHVIQILFLFVISMNACFATQWTVIKNMTRNPVQCNKWGWVYDHHAMVVWKNTCSPLEVQSLDNKSEVFTIPSTENRCQDNQYAIYAFAEGNNEIRFIECMSLKKSEMQKIARFK